MPSAGSHGVRQRPIHDVSKNPYGFSSSPDTTIGSRLQHKPSSFVGKGDLTGPVATPVRILHVVGARPNFMKVAPIMACMANSRERFSQTLVHTGQHYDDNMSTVFFDDLCLPKPDVYLGVGPGSHASQTARIMMAFEPILESDSFDWVVVVGDVNSTIACALTAAKMGVKVAHVEAGLRSYDRSMPEEHNRTLTDHLADALFTHSREADENLRGEGIAEHSIHFVGNVMIDSLKRLTSKAADNWRNGLRERLGLLDHDRFVLATLHRPVNVDNVETLAQFMSVLRKIAIDTPVVFPVHPRTRARIDAEMNGGPTPTGNLRIVEPLGYVDFLAAEAHASLVITDSGGVQEETTSLNVPCLTVRENTERPVTITHGTNRLVTGGPASLHEAVVELMGAPATPVSRKGPPELWDGHAAERIVEILGQRESASLTLPAASRGAYI